MLKRLPVVIQLYPDEVHKADLIRELKIDRHQLDRELIRQPTLYAWWASLYSAVASRAAKYREQLEQLDARLSVRFSRKLRFGRTYLRAGEVKHHVLLSARYQKIKARVRRWDDAERQLKHAVRAFEQRKDCLQTYCANERRERDAEPKVKRHHREDD